MQAHKYTLNSSFQCKY